MKSRNANSLSNKPVDAVSPCSNLIPLEKYVCRRSETASLTRDQLDLVLIGAVMSVLNSDNESEDKSHKSKQQEKIYSSYLFGGQRVCRRTYQFLLGVRKDRLQAIKAERRLNNTHTRKRKKASS